MKKNKGFTLIELLAVIVILAIIALIAVPVVMNIINKASKSAFKDSAYGLLKAGELFYADMLLENAGLSQDQTFTFPDNIEGLEFKGNKPSNGSMIVNKDGKIAMAITNGKYCVTKDFDEEEVIIGEDDGNCKLLSDKKTLNDFSVTTFEKIDKTEGRLEKPDCLINGSACITGTPVAVEVARGKRYKFYVISDDGENVSLIMDRNLGDEVAWLNPDDLKEITGLEWSNVREKSHYGPLSALKELKRVTSDWKYMPDIEINSFENNNKLEINLEKSFVMKARMLTYAEAYELKTANGGHIPGFLKDNLAEEKAYWMSSTYSSTDYYYAYNIGDEIFVSDINSEIGIRPVITLPK